MKHPNHHVHHKEVKKRRMSKKLILIIILALIVVGGVIFFITKKEVKPEPARRPVHGRAGQPDHAGAFPEIPDGGRLRGRRPDRARAGDPVGRLFPEQGQGHHRRGPPDRRDIRRCRPGFHGGARHAARGGPQDGQHRFIRGLR